MEIKAYYFKVAMVILISGIWHQTYSLPCVTTGDDNNGTTIDCRNKHLQQIPVDLCNSLITVIDLRDNEITCLPKAAFSKCDNLRRLYLSGNKLACLQKETLQGLGQLRLLDLKDSFCKPLPDNIFSHTPSLETLHLCGPALNKKSLSNLAELSELLIFYGRRENAFDIPPLPNLRILTYTELAVERLTKSMLAPLRDLPLEELSFAITSGMHSLDTDAFSGLNLTLMNFACNQNLHFDNIIDAISNSTTLRLESLIMDSVGCNYLEPLALGYNHSDNYKNALKGIKHLSIRNIGMYKIHPELQQWLPKIESLAAGMNTLKDHKKYINKRISSLVLRLKSLDMSYSGIETKVLNQTCRARQNQEYFPALFQARNFSVISPPNDLSCDRPENCTHPLFPEHIEYIQASDSVDLLNNPLNGCFIIGPNNLRYVNVSRQYRHGNVEYQFIAIGLNKLEILDISSIGMLMINFKLFCYLPSLRVLNMKDNLLGHRNFTVLPQMPSLELLDISSNGITELPEHVFANLPKIRHINLEDNRLSNMNFLADHVNTLEVLNLRKNILSELGRNETSRLEEYFGTKKNFVLDISDNPLQCGCCQLDFIRWIKTTTINMRNHEKLECKQGTDTMIIYQIDLERMQDECNKSINEYVISSATISLVIVNVIALFVAIQTYKNRWRLKWAYYKWNASKKFRRQPILLDEFTQDEGLYSIYIIYPNNDDVIKRWVCDVLHGQLQARFRGLSVCMIGQNNIAGWSKVDNIVHSILKSHTAIWVASKSFITDLQCETAANFAFQELGPSKNILVIMEKEIERYVDTGAFRNLLNSKKGVTRLRYTEDEAGRQLFWVKLEAYLAVHVM